MADVDGNLKDWSTTAASNKPTGATTIGTNLDDNLREIEKVVRQDLAHKGADIASATTTDLGAVAGLMHDITGTTTITGFGTVSAGIWKIVKFEGALTLTHNSTSLILPGGANITTANGDVGIFISEGSGNWRCLSYTRADDGVLKLVNGTEQATTSGTTKDFTIPSWAKRITVQLVAVSTDSTSSLLVQLGDSGGVETTGYVASASAPNGTTQERTDGFPLTVNFTAAQAAHGQFILTLQDSSDNTWVGSGNVYLTGTGPYHSAGSKALSAALTTVRLTSVTPNTFDAGAVNVLYE